MVKYSPFFDTLGSSPLPFLSRTVINSTPGPPSLKNMLDWIDHTLILPSDNPYASIYKTVLGLNEKLMGRAISEVKAGLVTICRALYERDSLFVEVEGRRITISSTSPCQFIAFV